MTARKTGTQYWRWGLMTAVGIAAVVVLWRNWPTVRAGLAVAYRADLLWFGLVLACGASTYILAAAAYNRLTLHPLRYRQTLLVEVASAFVNRLLPAGIGGLGLHGDYLYKRKHTVAQATAVVSVNNLLGILGHMLLLGAILLLVPEARVRVTVHISGVWVLAAVALLFGCAVLITPVRQRVMGFVTHVMASVRRLHMVRLAQALLCLVGLTALNTMALWAAGKAVGLHVAMPAALVVLSCGVFGATLTPTPGGLVGAEAGLVTGYALFDVSATSATAAIVLFRLAVYWLPVVPGVVALDAIRRQHLV